MSSLSGGGGGIASCTLLDHFGEAVQLVLAVVAFGSLIIKRKRERPPRPWLVWGLDTSKQVVSSGAAHGVGIITALLLNSQADEVSQCAWYAWLVAIRSGRLLRGFAAWVRRAACESLCVGLV